MKGLIDKFNVTSINTNLLNVIERNETWLKNLKWLIEDEIDFDSLKMPTNAVNYSCRMYDWYGFLLKAYNALSDYEVQKDTDAYLATN